MGGPDLGLHRVSLPCEVLEFCGFATTTRSCGGGGARVIDNLLPGYGRASSDDAHGCVPLLGGAVEEC
jgi:hypothetical protein